MSVILGYIDVTRLPCVKPIKVVVYKHSAPIREGQAQLASNTGMEVRRKAYARVGLLGNPSDGYYGKTISFSLANFFAEVALRPSEKIQFIPHPIHDPAEFDSMELLAERTKTEGYYGGIRLLMATCSKLYTYCTERDIELPHGRNFTLSYDTNIPRQAGLSGSSAIVCAALSCLLDFLDIGAHIPIVDRPSLILSAETELGITAGLQDRVIQVYGGLVYMDFAKAHLESTGNGLYTPLDAALLPPLHIIYAVNPADSGKVHSLVKRRWLEGDASIRAGMEEVASLAEKGRVALQQHDTAALARLMDRNFDLRRRMFGNEALGAVNVQMVEVARSVGAAAKFTGSGGAVVAFCPEGPAQVSRLQAACSAAGFSLVPASIAPSHVDVPSVEI